MDNNLNLISEKKESKYIIYLEGEIDVYSVPDFKEKLYKIIDEEALDIEISCEGLTYIDSSGLGILVGALKRVKQNGNHVYISNLKDNIKKLFLITGLDRVFDII